MKKKHWKHALALVLGAALLWGTALPAAAAWTQEAFDTARGNLVQNPGFEKGTAGWIIKGDVAVDKAAAYSGAAGMLFKGPFVPEIGQEEITLKGQTDYVLNVVAKSAIKQLSSLDFAFQTKYGKQRLSAQKVKTGWHRYSYTLSFPEDTTGTLLISAGGSTDVYIDDICLAPASALTPSIPTDAGQNVLANGGFEAGLAGWKALIKENEYTEPTGSMSTIEPSSDAHSGQKSLHVSRSTGYPKAVAQLPSDMPAGEYEVTAYVKAPNPASGATMDLTFRNTDILHTYEFATLYYSFPIKNSDWHKISFTIHLTPDTPAYYLAFSGMGTRDYLIDDVSAVPTGYSLSHSDSEQNLLLNSGFESGLSGWTQQGSPNSFSTDGQVYEGTYAAYFGYFAGEPLQNYLEQTVAAGAGNYAFSAMVKPDTTLQGVGCMLTLEALDRNGAVLASAFSPAVYDPSRGWQKTGATLTAPAGTASLRLKIGGIYCTGAFYVDEASLQPA